MPNISVIVPVYKVEPHLNRCIDSILNQTYTDFELILVDDGSPDNCPIMCDEYAKIDPRVHVIHQKNGGLSAARNAGIDWVFENSNSEWITFIDSDDWIHTEMLQWLYDVAMNSDVSVSACSYIEADGSEPPHESKSCEAIISSPEKFYVNHTVLATIACAKLYKIDCFADVRYPVGKIHEDVFITYKILFAQEKIAYTLADFYYYYVNHQGITKSPWTPKRLDGLDALQEQIEFFISNGFCDAARRALISYIISADRNIKAVEKEKEYKPLKKKLAKEFKRTYKKYKYLIPFSQNAWVYEKITPKKVKIYWLYKGVTNKLKSLYGVNNA